MCSFSTGLHASSTTREALLPGEKAIIQRHSFLEKEKAEAQPPPPLLIQYSSAIEIVGGREGRTMQVSLHLLEPPSLFLAMLQSACGDIRHRAAFFFSRVKRIYVQY